MNTMCCTKSIPNTVAISVKMDTRIRYDIESITRIEDRQILGIYVRCQDAAGTKQDEDGNTLVSALTLGKAHLQVKYGTGQKHTSLPLDMLVNAEKNNNPGDYALVPLKSLKGSDATIILGSAPTASDEGNVIELVFIVADKAAC